MAAIVVVACGGGCARTLVQHSSADAHTRLDATSELDFWDELAQAPAVSNRDALHAIALEYKLLGTGAEPNFESELRLARERNWVSGSDELVSSETASVGWIARAVCLESGIDGGLTMRLVGPVPRYAVRELAYLGFIPQTSEWQPISGLRLIALLSKAERRAAPESTTEPTEGF
ncbi:MAG: hypothetical protein HYR85_03505 [Planctomycetes bacterium]|nr:hypothetical protein [Planctomycetota bacterium]MBI3845907.1 hypothetical protein [Planctomycetota bacterium]